MAETIQLNSTSEMVNDNFHVKKWTILIIESKEIAIQINKRLYLCQFTYSEDG